MFIVSMTIPTLLSMGWTIQTVFMRVMFRGVPRPVHVYYEGFVTVGIGCIICTNWGRARGTTDASAHLS